READQRIDRGGSATRAFAGDGIRESDLLRGLHIQRDVQTGCWHERRLRHNQFGVRHLPTQKVRKSRSRTSSTSIVPVTSARALTALRRCTAATDAGNPSYSIASAKEVISSSACSTQKR